MPYTAKGCIQLLKHLEDSLKTQAGRLRVKKPAEKNPLKGKPTDAKHP